MRRERVYTRVWGFWRSVIQLLIVGDWTGQCTEMGDVYGNKLGSYDNDTFR